MRTVAFAVLLFLTMLAFSGCQQASETTGPAPDERATQPAQTQPTPRPAETQSPADGPSAPEQPSATPDRSIRLTPGGPDQPGSLPEKIPTIELPAPLVSNLPGEIVMPVIADLSERLGPNAPQITVERAEKVTWNDGSLGCPKPGMMYTQALVDGYWIVLKAGDQSYDYRASTSGHFFLCESGAPPALPAGTPAQ